MTIPAISRAAELIKLNKQGKITNKLDVCLQIEREFKLPSRTAFRYVAVEAAAIARRLVKGKS